MRRAGVHKILLLLGLLRRGPLTGYDLHRIVRAHGELYSHLKKANLYYLLDRLAKEGALTVQAEPHARGPRGERLLYTITDQGRAQFDRLLCTVVREYDPVHVGIDVAIVFLAQLLPAEARALLADRREAVAQRRAQLVLELGETSRSGPFNALAADHLLSLVDAELKWVERALNSLDTAQAPPMPMAEHRHSSAQCIQPEDAHGRE